MRPPVTGDDYSELLQVVEANGIDHASVSAPHWVSGYRVDYAARFVHVDGGLLLPRYFAALAAGVSELVDDNVLWLPTRAPGRARRTS